ncbi:MAG: hypothetical protein IH585_05475 [Anaerolineaceae bacterium]|nr:hypothetical protein [Anaerolineaceae bacterium]
MVLPTQVDVKTKYPDGSLRQVVVSVLLPKISAKQDLPLLLVSSPSANNSGELSKEAILATEVGATISLSGLSGSGYAGDLTADLRAAIESAPQLNYWLKGPVCSEVLVNQSLNRSLNATWEVRIYPGTPHIRISHAIENVNLQSRGNVSYALSISQGKTTPAQVYSKSSFQHHHSSRWRKVIWLGQAPPEVEIRYDLPYMISTGMVMPYDTSLQVPETVIASMVSTWKSRGVDIFAETHVSGTGWMSGLINMSFGATGGRPEIGLLPRWAAMYLLSMDNRLREILLWHGEMSGNIPIHYREDDPAKSFYGRPVSIDDRPTVSLHSINTAFPPIGVTTTNWAPDRAHQGSFAYLPYIITGEKWYLDEIYYWGGYNLVFHEYMRDGNGSQDFSLGKNGSFGSLYDQLRGLDWALRNISDASIVASDADPERLYFANKTKNNIDWLALANAPGTTGHGLHAVRHQREHTDTPKWPTKTIAPWQHDFLVIVLSDMIRKDAASNSLLCSLRDHLAKFTIGRFTNDPVFPKFEGAGYWWPLADKNGNYYTDKDWGRYWSDVASYIGKTSTNPATSFSSSDYAYSYAAIALGATALISNLPGGADAYNLLRANLSYDRWAKEDPTWAFRVNIQPPKNFLLISQ